MDHFYQGIQGWCNFEAIYQEAVQRANNVAHFVEVGSWRGRSLSYLAVTVINSGKNIHIDAIDTWRGSWAEDVHQNDPSVVNDTLYNEFLTNIEPVKDIITPIRMTSLEAAAQYADESLDFIFIDASHEYEDVKKDILAWLPKLKTGCWMAGDDYGSSGVAQAVDELFPGKNSGAHWRHEKQ